MTLRFRVLGLLAVAAVVGGACSSGGTATQSSGPTTKIVATAPTNQLIKAGTLTVCSDTSYPPQEKIDSSTNKAVGSDIDLVAEIAARMGLKLDVKSTVFDTIIPALTGGGCDIIVSAQTITDKRKEAVDMIPYFEAGQSFVVLKGNPKGIKALTDLCGQNVAVEKGTVEADNLQGTNDYDGAGIKKTCTDAGKQPPTAKIFDADTDALLALQSGTVVAHFTDEPVAGYEVKQGNGQFEQVQGLVLEHAPEGISVAKNHPELRDAVKAALKSMIDDGTYLTILKKWGVESGALSTPLQ